MKIGVLTGGGDCPGLNAVIRAVMRKAIIGYDYEVAGIMKGWQGLIEGWVKPLGINDAHGILHQGGTILRTSRTNLFKNPEDAEKGMANLKKFKIDALVAIGGDDTLGVAYKLWREGVKVVGVPKTIDNDLSGTEVTFGFDTAVNIAAEAVDRATTTAESHDRVIVVEVMGRHAGWIALHAGIAGGAEMILIPERPVDLDEVCERLKARRKRGRDYGIVVVAEGATLGEGQVITSTEKKDAFGNVRLGGIGNVLAEEIEERTGFETRAMVLGHLQRGGTPTAFDRVLGTRLGVAAVELIAKGEFGKMVALQCNKIVPVELGEAIEEKLVTDDWYEMAQVLF